MITLTFFNTVSYEERVNIAEVNDRKLTRTPNFRQGNV